MPDGVILVFNVRYQKHVDQRTAPPVHPLAAIKSAGRWYVTGSGPRAAGWGAIERWLERDNRELVSVEIATGARTIWPDPVETLALDDADSPHPEPTGETL